MMPDIKKILYATDLSDNSAYALRYARKPVFIIPLPKGETDLTFHDL